MPDLYDELELIHNALEEGNITEEEYEAGIAELGLLWADRVPSGFVVCHNN